MKKHSEPASNFMISRRSFLRTCAGAAAGSVLLNSDWPRVPAVAAAPQTIAGVVLDDLPLLGPYLLPTETPHQSLRVAFRGTVDKTRQAAGALRFGLKKAGEKEIAFQAAPQHVLELKGLAPDAEYQYRLDLGDYQSPLYRFRTSPPPGQRAQQSKVALLFDFHTHSPKDKGNQGFFGRYEHSLADLKKFAPDLLLLGGDIVNIGNRRAEYDTFFRLLRPLCANAVLVPCPGNHEWAYDKDLSIYADYLPMPKNGPTYDPNSSWSFVYGGVGFQMRRKGRGAWLAQNIKKLQKKGGADFIVDTQHLQVFMWTRKHGRNLGRKGVCDVFDQTNAARLCLFGHRHMHQRTYPLLYRGGPKATTKEKADYGPATKGTIYMQSPSMWYQFAHAQAHPLVAVNGKPSFAGSYTGFGEMTITPDAVVTETFVNDYSGKVRHERVDQFRMARAK